MIHLVLGGARSGKSRHALNLAEQSRLPVTFIATARAGDAEMAARIAHHQAERPGHWQTVEEPLHLAEALERAVGERQCVVVDCLTLWLVNWLDELHSTRYPAARDKLLATLPKLKGEAILVANEVGLGVVPMGELTRRYVDEAGRLNQAIAQIADNVVLLAAGLPLSLKATPINDEGPNW